MTDLLADCDVFLHVCTIVIVFTWFLYWYNHVIKHEAETDYLASEALIESECEKKDSDEGFFGIQSRLVHIVCDDVGYKSETVPTIEEFKYLGIYHDAVILCLSTDNKKLICQRACI